MITISDLTGVDITLLVQTFNEAFSAYYVPFQLTTNQLEARIKSDNIDMGYSIGAYDGPKLVGFVLHGVNPENDVPVLYNSGTGVLASYRGQHLTRRMYQHFIPLYRNAGMQKIYLEVIADNLPGRKSYEHIGFEYIRLLNCYKGQLSQMVTENQYNIAPIAVQNVLELKGWGQIRPTMQNIDPVIERMKDHFIAYGAWKNDRIAGYAIYYPAAKKLLQIAVHPQYRRSGIARSLLRMISSNHSDEIVITNVDENSEELNALFYASGLTTTVQQYEMVLHIDTLNMDY